jgi:hypothetical protein
MQYVNNSYAVYSISKLGSSYYVRPQVNSGSFASVLELCGLYLKNNVGLYSPGGQFKIYNGTEDKNADIDFDNYDSSKEIGDFFQKINSKPSVFAGIANDIISQIQFVFYEVTKQEFPYDLKIEFCDSFTMQEKYKSSAKEIWDSKIKGFCINSKDKSVYILYDTLVNMMLTLGHEIGHILTPARHNKITEEAKAYAFEIIWISKIKELNIFSLSDQIDLSNLGTPAANGIHDAAFMWVNSFMMEGKTAKEIYEDIIKGELMISNT